MEAWPCVGTARPFLHASLLVFGVTLLLLAPTTTAQVPLTFVNEETTVSRVSFKFVDAQTFEEDRLKEQIATAAPGFWDRVRRILPFVDAREYPFDPIVLQKDVARLRIYYANHGFLHPYIDYPASQLDTTTNTIHVIFTLEEGPPLIIQDVGFYAPDGGYAYEQFESPLRERWIAFRDRTTLEVGSRYTRFDRIRIQDQVLTWLQNAGFAFAQVDTEADIDSTANTADLAIFIDPGPRTIVGDIIVEGAETVSRDVVLREVPLKIGNRFSHRRMIQGQRELFSLNLFRVALADLPEQPVDSTVVVRYRVREASPRYVSAQTGYARDNGFMAEASWRHRNFLGGARQLTISGAVQSGYGARLPGGYTSARQFNASVSLRQPYIYTTRLSGILSPFYVWQDNPSQELKFQEVGLNTTLLYEFYTFRTVSLQHTFSRAFGDTQALARRNPDPDSPNRLDIYNRSIFSLSGTFGDVDDFLNPEEGFLVRPFAEAAGSLIASDVDYYKLSNEVVGYYPVTEQIGVSGRLFTGRVWPLGGSRDQNDPLIEARFDRIRFYAGGGTDVRGYPDNLLGPVRLDTVYTLEGDIDRHDDGTPNVRYEPLGGLGKIAANVELRMPFPGLSDDWRTAAFIDAGQVYPEADFSLRDLRYGVGGGIRYETLVGFIRLDLAFKVNPTETDLHSPEEVWRVRQGLDDELTGGFWNRFRLHLSIGQAF